ncbi:MAG: pilus assembly protein PilM [Planctomycetes bacterium]|nr:pilus assembly protein PilM [Planctomycetota bacterium]
MKLGSSSRTAIGVDIGLRTIRAAQLSAANGSALAMSLVPRPRAGGEIGPDDALALREVLARQGFKDNRIVLAAPRNAILPAAMELPSKVNGAPIDQIVRLELSRLHNLAPDSFEMAYWDLKAAGGTKPVTHTLAVACPHEAANAFLDIFEDAGFRVVALDVRGAAVARACEPLLLPAPQVTAILDIGLQSAALLFVCGRSLLYERPLDPPYLVELTAKLADVFGITQEAATQILGTVGPSAKEPTGQFDRETLAAVGGHLRTHFEKTLEGLKVPLSYAKHQFPGDGVKRMLLIGSGATVPDLASYFEPHLGFEVKRADPASLIDSPPGLLAKASNPALTVAVGLAKFEGGDGWPM